MANTSSACGSMTLMGGWKRGHIDALNRIAKMRRAWRCGMDMRGELSPETLPLPFSGFGRRTFESSLECLGSWTKSAAERERLPDCGALTEGMEANWLSIAISFSDEESGFLFFAGNKAPSGRLAAISRM
jgi:hypothetical protein